MMASKPAPSGGGFNPLSLSPFVMLDFTDITTLWQDAAKTVAVAANNDPVGGIDDLSGNGTVINQVTSIKRPLYKTNMLNGLPGIQFDGVDDYLMGNITQTYPDADLYMVLRIDSATDGSHVVSSISGGNYNAIIRVARWSSMLAINGGVLPYTDYVNGVFALARLKATSTTRQFFKNNISILTESTGGLFRGNIIGGSESGTATAGISLCEYHLYPALSAADNTSVTNWFNAKYGL